MRDIIIVEDRLERGICLIKLFTDLGEKHQEYEIKNVRLGYFNTKVGKAEQEVEEYRKEYNIEVLSLWNFEDDLDVYYEKGAVIVMDFLLENDGSDGIVNRRVNIRYAKDKLADGRIWFYTTKRACVEMLTEKVGASHVLEVVDVDGENIVLDVNGNEFVGALTGKGASD